MLKKLFTGLLITSVLLSSLCVYVYATDVTWTFNLYDAATRQRYTGNATLEIRGNYINTYYNVSSGQKSISVPTGSALGYNIRANGYLSYPATSSIIPTSDRTFNIYISSATPFANYGYTAPFDSYTISSNFGWRSWASEGYSYYNNFDNHRGVDMPKTEGTEISSIGNVNAADFTSGWDNSEGWYVHIEPASSYTVRYMHMESKFGITGQTAVSQGECIGYVGNTGNSFGAHLHIDISYNNVTFLFYACKVVL